MDPTRERLHASAMTTDQLSSNKQLVVDFIQDLFTKGDLDAVDRYLDPAFVNHNPPYPGGPNGPDGMREASAIFRAALPDWHSDVDQLIAEADIVMERFHASGTHTGELFGVPPTGRVLVLAGVNIFRISGDRIVERWGCLDMAGLQQQLATPPA